MLICLGVYVLFAAQEVVKEKLMIFAAHSELKRSWADIPMHKFFKMINLEHL